MQKLTHNVWILADRNFQKPGSRWLESPLALVQVAGRTLLEYVMDELFEAQIKSATLALSCGVTEIRNRLAGGARWDIQVKEALTRGDAGAARALAQRPGEGPAILVYADRFRAPCLARFLRHAARLRPRRIGDDSSREPGTIVGIGEDGQPLGLELVTGFGGSSRRLVLPDAKAFSVDTPAGLHAAQEAAVTGRAPASLHGRELSAGVWAGRQVSIGRNVRFEAPVFLASGCEIGADSVIGPKAFVGQDCILESGVRLHDATVLADTFIGSRSHVETALVSGSATYSLARDDSDSTTAALRKLDLQDLARSAKAGALKAVLAVSIVLALPLIVLWLLWAVGGQRGRLFERRRFLSNRSERGSFEACHATARVPFRRLPWLLAVFRGDLDLLGIRPREPSAGKGGPPWCTEVLSTARAGLLSPAHLVPKDATLEADLAEATWLAERSLLGDSVLLCRLAAHGCMPQAAVATGA